jgi:hypothetical protein
MPRWLPEEERREWRRLAKQLAPILTAVDRGALAVLCCLSVRISRPDAKAADIRAYLRWAAEFGLVGARRIPSLPENQRD